MSDPLEPTRVDQPVVRDDPTLLGQPVVPGDEWGGPPGGPLPPGGPVPPPPPDRRPWIIAAVLALIVLTLILILLLQDDDEDGDVDASATTSSSVSSTTSSSTSTSTTSTTVAPSTTQAEVPVTVPPEECAEAGEGEAQPGLAAETVFDAWVRGDEACAAELMAPAALAELFSRDGEGATDQFQGCTQADDPAFDSDCTYTYEGGATHYLMTFSNSDGWRVEDVEQVAD